MIRAAGILFITPQSEVLFLKRATGDHVGEWCFPGGGTENGETAEETAIREVIEEIGALPNGERAVWTRRIAEGVDYTTFIQRVPEKFTPPLNDEHSGFMWLNVADAIGAPSARSEI